MKILAGVMCYVCFFAVAVASLADTEVHCAISEREVDTISTDLSESARPNQAAVKAVRIEIVSMQGCPPCKRLKETTVPALKEAGYKVKVIDIKDDVRGTKACPTIYYLGRLGSTTRKDVGYRTYKQVIKHMEKP